MNKFKRLFSIIFVACVCALTLGACSNTTRGGSAKGSTDLDIDNPIYAFVKEEDYDPDTFEFKTNKLYDLDVDSDYFLFLSFDVHARRNNDGQSVLNVNITFDSLDILEASVQQADTGSMIEMSYLDANTGMPGKTITLSFRVPPQSAKPRTIEMTVRLKPATKGESHILIAFDYDTDDKYVIQGAAADGFTQLLNIKAVEIESPELELTDLGALRWKHVKNADYYYFYENTNEPLRDAWGDVIKVEAKDIQVGDYMSYNIAEDIVGYHTLRIKAFNNNDRDYIASKFSNEIENYWA